MINEPVEGSSGTGGGSEASGTGVSGGGGAPTGGAPRPPAGSNYITVTPQEREAIDRVSILNVVQTIIKFT